MTAAVFARRRKNHLSIRRNSNADYVQ